MHSHFDGHCHIVDRFWASIKNPFNFAFVIAVSWNRFVVKMYSYTKHRLLFFQTEEFCFCWDKFFRCWNESIDPRMLTLRIEFANTGAKSKNMRNCVEFYFATIQTIILTTKIARKLIAFLKMRIWIQTIIKEIKEIQILSCFSEYNSIFNVSCYNSIWTHFNVDHLMNHLFRSLKNA